MFWRKKDKEKERFYLLAGMGGRSARRKHLVILLWSLVAGLLVSIAFAIALYFFSTRR
jgi:high-affinity Fe2+/Pb2+ permease